MQVVYGVAGVAGVIAFLILFYLIRNGLRNADPMNRKCAAEICQYLVFDCEEDGEEFDPMRILAIFNENARYQKQAMHVVSMVPPLLIEGGMDEDASMAVAQPLLLIAVSLPK